MTSISSGETGHRLLGPIKMGAVVGAIGGALIGLVESIGTLITLRFPPASVEAGDVVALVAGLFLLSVLTVLGAALGVAVMGALLGLWQTLRREILPSSRQAALLGTGLTVLYGMIRVVDSVGVQELTESYAQAFTWGLFLLGMASGLSAASWFVFERILRAKDSGTQKDP